jgi:hypothetical protein
MAPQSPDPRSAPDHRGALLDIRAALASRWFGASADLVAHRVSTRLERVAQTLGLSLHQIAAPVEPILGATLDVTGQFVGPFGKEAAALLSLLGDFRSLIGEKLPGLASGARGQQDSRRRADGRTE